MDNEKKPPFPQANDFEKVKQLILIPDANKLLSDSEIGEYLGGITERQSRYYIAAARYLGAVDEHRHLTQKGISLRTMDDITLKAELIRILFSDPVVGRVYILQKVLGFSMDKMDIAEIIEQENPGYTEVIYLRRSQTVLSWMEWIYINIGEK